MEWSDITDVLFKVALTGIGILQLIVAFWHYKSNEKSNLNKKRDNLEM